MTDRKEPDSGWQVLTLIFFAILLVYCIISMHGCCPAAHLPVQDNTSTHVRDSVVVRDSLVLVPVPVEASQNILPATMRSHVETSLASSDAWVDTTGLHHTIANKDTDLPVHVPVTEHHTSTETQHSQETATTQTVYVEVEKELSRWQSFKIRAFWYICGAVVLLLAWCTRKWWARLLL